MDPIGRLKASLQGNERGEALPFKARQKGGVSSPPLRRDEDGGKFLCWVRSPDGFPLRHDKRVEPPPPLRRRDSGVSSPFKAARQKRGEWRLCWAMMDKGATFLQLTKEGSDLFVG